MTDTEIPAAIVEQIRSDFASGLYDARNVVLTNADGTEVTGMVYDETKARRWSDANVRPLLLEKMPLRANV